MEKVLNALTDAQLTALLRWAVGVLLVAAVWLVKREFSRISEACDRIPTKEWFAEMKDSMEKVVGLENARDTIQGDLKELKIEQAGMKKEINDLNIRFARSGLGRRREDQDRAD